MSKNKNLDSIDTAYLEELITVSAETILIEMFGGNEYYAYRRGALPVLLVAHADTVFKAPPKPSQICKSETEWSAPDIGLGADDRAGIYIASKIIEQLDCSLVITNYEETGAAGAEHFANDCKDSYDFIIEFDRKNSNDAVFYDCYNKEFQDAVLSQFYDHAIGSLSDISIIAPQLDIAAVNLSCGYYYAHSPDEILNLSEMQKAIVEGKKLIKRLLKTNKHFRYDNS
ncbi:MAG: hypothetical protein LBP59_19500 [Planctomycetaceae bacterium]|jgi:acetylornithine deacetylase/succinyl-diaminopimelate desuccinylase-like protein|nr:hypothetical protein [Planctomycetaceae bacterium]